MFFLFSRNSVDTLGGSYRRRKAAVLRSVCRAGVSGYFVSIYSTFMPLEALEVHFDCAGSQNLPARGGCF